MAPRGTSSCGGLKSSTGNRGEARAYLVLGDAGVTEALVVGLVAALPHGVGGGHRACEVFIFWIGAFGGRAGCFGAIRFDVNGNNTEIGRGLSDILPGH